MQVRHWTCWEARAPACICGVTVREGNTLFAVDMCDGVPGQTPNIKLIEYNAGGQMPLAASFSRDASWTWFTVSTVLYNYNVAPGKTFGG